MRSLLFVVGAPRSGSTFVVRALDRHPEISMTNEGGWVPFLRKASLLTRAPSLHPIDDGEGFETVGILPLDAIPPMRAAFAATVPQFLDNLAGAWSARGRYFGDKVQGRNDIEFCRETFPEARYVFLVRDPRDVLVSSYAFQAVETVAWQHASFEVRVRELGALLGAARSALTDRPHRLLRYEEMVVDPERALEDVFGFLGLDPSPEVCEWINGDAAKLFDRQGTSASPAASVGRWRTELTPEQRDVIESALGEHLAALGYDP